jgi:Protein of unknwon function (DUF3310)
MIEEGAEHYKSGKVEPLELIEAQSLSFHLGNVVKYATRAAFQHRSGYITLARESIDKAIWYLQRFKEVYLR